MYAAPSASERPIRAQTRRNKASLYSKGGRQSDSEKKNCQGHIRTLQHLHSYRIWYNNTGRHSNAFLCLIESTSSHNNYSSQRVKRLATNIQTHNILWQKDRRPFRGYHFMETRRGSHPSASKHRTQNRHTDHAFRHRAQNRRRHHFPAFWQK